MNEAKLIWVETAVVIKATWDPKVAACVVLETRHNVFASSIVFSTCMDFVVLALCAWKLLPRRANSRLTDLLCSDGLVYFLAACVVFVSSQKSVLLTELYKFRAEHSPYGLDDHESEWSDRGDCCGTSRHNQHSKFPYSYCFSLFELNLCPLDCGISRRSPIE